MLLLGSLLLVVSVMCTEREYFHISNQTTWDDARIHCQICYKDLTPITPTNAEVLGFNLSSDYWVGLRQNMSGSKFWQGWVNGDPVLYQNWYPGHPVPKKKPEPQPTCPPPPPTTPPPPSPSPSPTDNSQVLQCPAFAKLCSCLNSSEDDINDFEPTMMYNIRNDTILPVMWCPALSKLCDCLNSSKDDEVFITESTTVLTTSYLVTTPIATTLPSTIFPEMITSEPEYIEDSCVALLSFGMWQEKQCNESLPYICYDDRFVGRVDITKLTKAEVMLNWTEAGIGIEEYIVKIAQDQNETISRVNSTSYQFDALAPGSLYLVQVIPVKCNRSLNPQNTSFYTLPEEIRNLNIVGVETTTIRLNWTASRGTKVSYLVITDMGNENLSCSSENCAMTSLKQGQQYNFTVKAAVNKTTFGEPGYITACTKPSKVTGLRSSDNESSTIYAEWNSTDDNSLQYMYKTILDNARNVVVTNLVKFENCTPGTNYSLTVAAIEPNCSQEGEASSIIAYTTPMPVNNLWLTSTDNSIYATWKQPTGSFSYFHLEISSSMLPNTNWTTFNTTDLSYNFLSLQTAALYNITVRTYVKSDLRPSEPASATIFTRPKPPRNAIVQIINTTVVNISWLNPENADDVAGINYAVKYFSDFWQHGGMESVIGVKSVVISGLKSGSMYGFNVTVLAGNLTSLPATTSGQTNSEIRNLTITMMCSSSTPLYCNNSTAKSDVLAAISKRINDIYNKAIFWDLTSKN